MGPGFLWPGSTIVVRNTNIILIGPQCLGSLQALIMELSCRIDFDSVVKFTTVKFTIGKIENCVVEIYIIV